MNVPANSVFQADCLTLLERVESGRITLVYFDPSAIFLDEDFHGELNDDAYLSQYLLLLSKVLQQIRRVLSEKGSLFLSLDVDISKNIRLMLDQIFGQENFRGEFVWPNGLGFSMTSHETMLRYSKSKDFIDNPQFRKLTDEEIGRIREHISPNYPFNDELGSFALMVYGLTVSTSDPALRFEWKGFVPPPGCSWRYSREQLDELDKERKICHPTDDIFPKSIPKFPLLKRYLHESSNLSREVQAGSLWDDIPPVNPRNYRTAKGLIQFVGERPPALLERIICMGSDPGDCVLDPACQLGTTLIAAQANDRKWIGCEPDEDMYSASTHRLEDEFGLCRDRDFFCGNQGILEKDYPIISDFYSKIVTGIEDVAKPKFILNQPVKIEETRHYEFKEIRGKNPVGSIKSIADQYAVAFLNSEGGRLYWGVRDSDRTVTGAELDYNQRDEIRRVITEKLTQIQPAIAPTQYRIEFHSVFDERSGDAVPDLYVVELVVPRGSDDFLYFTGSNEAYVKTDGGKKKLTGPEIQEEIIKRLQKNRETEDGK